MMTANRRATATIARFMPRCRAIFMPQALSHDHLRRWVIRTRGGHDDPDDAGAAPAMGGERAARRNRPDLHHEQLARAKLRPA